MSGRVIQVNISPGGVPKRAVDEARVGVNGLEGDGHHHSWVHGGPHRAVALFAIEAIRRVQADGHPGVVPGAVGENLTTEGIELARLPAGTRLAVGAEVLLEISGPANPCDVIKGAFIRGKSGRIAILLHPDDSRMYARVLETGTVRPGDAIRVLAPAAGSTARIHRELDALEAVDRAAWLAMWRAAAAAGFDVRILDRGDLTAAASPDLPSDAFNRAFGLRLVPVHRPEAEALFRAAGVPGWLVLGTDDPAADGELEQPTGVHVGPVDDVLTRSDGEVVPGLRIRTVDPADAEEAHRFAELLGAAAALDERTAFAWRRFNPLLVRAHGYHQLIASLDGRDVAVAALLHRRRIGWLGGGAVLPEARGRGIQRALIADRARRASEAGAHRLLATADVGGPSARNLEELGMPRIWTRGLRRVDPVG